MEHNRDETSLTIRDAVLSDAPDLAALMCELGYETTPTQMEQRLDWILTNPTFKTLLALVDGRACGMIGTVAYPTYERNGLSGKILALVTSKTARRCGIGRALITAAENDFAQRGIKQIALNTRLTREDAHRFYEALGYERNGWRFVKHLATAK
jgi:ribosomal protein S18 acetylase RimI-like enzyme